MLNYSSIFVKRGVLKTLIFIISIQSLMALTACRANKPGNAMKTDTVKLMTLAPGHFHAALVQKSMYPNVDPVVHVYAPEGSELQSHLQLIDKYNSRTESPTEWQEKVYKGEDFFEKMLEERPGNVVVFAGNNQRKTEYIKKLVDAGINVLADKPMAIDSKGFELLKQAFESADKNRVLLYDIMTERYEINSILQREFMQQKELFGELEKGTLENPAVSKESVHYFFKQVSGAPVVRPAWFYDVEQQAEGLVDVTTHLVDLIQWTCFPEKALNYSDDVRMIAAKRWPTQITPAQYKLSTNTAAYPGFLQKDVKDSILHVYSNGEMNYTLKGVHAKVSVIWNFQAPAGTGDTHFSKIRGTKANIIIRQGAEQNFKPTLYIEPLTESADFEQTLGKVINTFQTRFPGLAVKKSSQGWQIVIPDSLKLGHEDHFTQVTKSYLQYLEAGKLPDWEVPNMLAKYYTTTQALETARKTK